MVFSSFVFLFLFLPCVLLSHFALKGNPSRNFVLLLFSLVFYAWGEPVYIVLMLISIVVNYFLALLLDSSQKNRKRFVLFLGVIVNIGILLYYKYAFFFAGFLNTVFLGLNFPVQIPLREVHLPIGISFYTFHSLSYLVDIYRGKAKVQRNLLNLALYISFFPQLVAGPIIRYHDIEEQITLRKITLEKFSYGINRFICGLGKKVIVADTVGKLADQIFSLPATDLSMGVAWLGIIAYTIQIYFDFSAYSDMAIGLAAMFGFRFLENFNYPYIAQSIKEFWRRWHISLSTWFRDYLYIPLGGSREGTIKTYRNLLVVFLLTGLWHGASWSFIVWGLYHGFFLVIERTALGRLLSQLWRPLRHLYALLVVSIGWVFFRSETLGYSIAYIKTLLGFGGLNIEGVFTYLNNEFLLVLLIGSVFSTPLIPRLLELKQALPKYRSVAGFLQGSSLLILFLTSIIYIVLSLGQSAYVPFIYFQF